MRDIVASAVLAATLVLSTVGLAFAGGGNPSGTGQPNRSCETEGTRPGSAQNATGSAFNPDGTAGQHYAGEQDNNNNNPKSVSQYDVACVKNASQPPQ
jgi:hypothetical protein